MPFVFWEGPLACLSYDYETSWYTDLQADDALCWEAGAYSYSYYHEYDYGDDYDNDYDDYDDYDDDEDCEDGGWVCSYGDVYHEGGCSDDTCGDCQSTDGWDVYSNYWVGSSFDCFSMDGGTTYYSFFCSDSSSARSEMSYEAYDSDSTCSDDTYTYTHTIELCGDCDDDEEDEYSYSYDSCEDGGWVCSYGDVYHENGCSDDTCS